MFSNLFLRSFRILLFPFSLLYWLGITIRNYLYDRNIFKSASFGLPLICVGNLSVGGTGKSPMVEYLTELLKNQFKIAILSRGYKRKTKGYALAGPGTTALEIGDEPMQFHIKFPDVPVAVGEERIVAIPQLLHDRPGTEVVILDDAFQHRAVKAGLNILLTDYNNLFTRDFYLPTGDLRDLKKSYKRAHIIIITKCKKNISEQERKDIIKEINPTGVQKVYFTAAEYGALYHFLSGGSVTLKESTEILLVTGIANPRPLKKMLEQHHNSYQMIQFPDHHIFTIDDWQDIRKKFDSIRGRDKIILTTEKDAVRLEKFKPEMQDLPLFILPVRHQFLFGEGDQFDQEVAGFIKNFTRQIK